MSMGGSSIIIAKSSTKYKTQITNSQVFLGVFLWYFSNISQRISPDISRVFLGGISRGYFSRYFSGYVSWHYFGNFTGCFSGIGSTRIKMRRGSRCDEDQDATRIKMRQGSRLTRLMYRSWCTRDDAPGMMHWGWCSGDDALRLMHRGWCTGTDAPVFHKWVRHAKCTWSSYISIGGEGVVVKDY